MMQQQFHNIIEKNTHNDQSSNRCIYILSASGLVARVSVGGKLELTKTDQWTIAVTGAALLMYRFLLSDELLEDDEWIHN